MTHILPIISNILTFNSCCPTTQSSPGVSRRNAITKRDSELSALETNVYDWCYALLVVLAVKKKILLSNYESSHQVGNWHLGMSTDFVQPNCWQLIS